MIRQTCDRCGTPENRGLLFYLRLVRPRDQALRTPRPKTECLCADCLYDTMRILTRPKTKPHRPAPDIPLDLDRVHVTQEVKRQLEG